MIVMSNADSVIESLYLSIPLTSRNRDATIVVNPDDIAYVSGKTVIINRLGYPGESIRILQKNGNKIVSRIPTGVSGVKLIPYLPRIVPEIVWSGQTVDYLDENIYEDADFTFSDGILSFPKTRLYLGISALSGELNSLGFLLFQVGENLFPDGPFDLDKIKVKKHR